MSEADREGVRRRPDDHEEPERRALAAELVPEQRLRIVVEARPLRYDEPGPDDGYGMGC